MFLGHNPKYGSCAFQSTPGGFSIAGAGLAHACLPVSSSQKHPEQRCYSRDHGHPCFVPDLQGHVSAGSIKLYKISILDTYRRINIWYFLPVPLNLMKCHFWISRGVCIMLLADFVAGFTVGIWPHTLGPRPGCYLFLATFRSRPKFTISEFWTP